MGSDLSRALEQAQYTKNLHLDSLQITQIPNEVFDMCDVEMLSARSNGLVNVPPEIARLVELSELHLEQNQLENLPLELSKLSKLKEIHLKQNNLVCLPPGLCKLPSLVSLMVQKNDLDALYGVGLITSLTELAASGNCLKEIPAEICHLESLQFLYLGGNHIDSIPTEISYLTSLRELYLRNNRLVTLPAEIGQLHCLRILDLRGNQLEQVPTSMGLLQNLEGLHVSGNSLTTLPHQLGELKNLTTLDLWGNPLVTPPLEILSQGAQAVLAFLRALKPPSRRPSTPRKKSSRLLRQDSSISSSSKNSPPRRSPGEAAAGANNSKTEVSRTTAAAAQCVEPDQAPPPTPSSLKAKPHLLKRAPSLGTADGSCYDSPSSPRSPSVSLPVHRSKIMVVGDAAVGKTSLIRALKGEQYRLFSPATDGIDVGEWKLPLRRYQEAIDLPEESIEYFTFSTWDFAGQEIYYSSHQLFLSYRCIYLLVWNAMEDIDESRLEFWLHSVQTRVPGSTVLIVGTHIDQDGAVLPPKLMEVSASRFPALKIAGSVGVSNSTGMGIEELKDKLLVVAESQDHSGQHIPCAWLNFEKVLISTRESMHVPVISWDVVKDLAVKAGVEVLDDADVRIIVKLLHDWGTLLFFEFDDKGELIILDPQWITSVVSSVITTKSNGIVGGVLPHRHLRKLWAQYPRDLHMRLLLLLEQFELSYRLVKSHSLVPCLLEDTPNLTEWERLEEKEGILEVRRIYRFQKFFPLSLLPQTMVRAHQSAQKHKERGVCNGWSSGFVFMKNESHGCLVESYPEDMRLIITTRGLYPENLLSIISDLVEAVLSEKYPGHVWFRLAPCPSCVYEGTQYPNLFNVETCSEHLAVGRETVACDVCGDSIEINSVLFGVTPRNSGGSLREDRSSRVLDEDESDEDTQSVRSQEELSENRTQQTLLRMMDKVKDSVQQVVSEEVEMLERTLLARFEASENFSWQLYIEKATPSIFCIMPKGKVQKLSPSTVWKEKYVLHLLCEMPGQVHFTDDPGYEVAKPKRFLRLTAPYVAGIVKILRIAFQRIPKSLATAIERFGEDPWEKFSTLAYCLPTQLNNTPQAAKDLAMRELGSFLREIDPTRRWGNLCVTKMRDGKVAWLCKEHAAQFKVDPPMLSP